MSSTHTTAGDQDSNHRTSSASAEEQRWPSLPGDLLGEIYVKLAAPLSRARFAASCRSWRAAASTHPPPRALPWLMLDPLAGNPNKRMLYCPQDGAVLPRLPIQGAGAGACFVGCYDGGWAALSGPPLRIVNLFSGAEVELSPEQKRGTCESRKLVFEKIVFSAAPTPTSHGCILAALTDDYEIAVCTVGDSAEGGWILRSGYYGESLVDVAFCSNGELYGLTFYSKELNKFEIGMHEEGMPFFKAVYRLAMQNPCEAIFPEEHGVYIVELCGKIVMAVRRTQGQPFFAVFELVDAGGDGATTDRLYYKWADLTSLGNHALFLGPTCSKAVHVPAGGHGYARKNHIYYAHHRCLTAKNKMPGSAKEFLGSSSSNGNHRIYYKEYESIDNNIEGIMSIGYYARGGFHPPMWILPPDL